MSLPPTRHYPGQRMLRITCRTVHIGSAALILGGAYFNQVDDLEQWVLPIMVGSGLLILVDDFIRRGAHLVRMAQFWILMLKLSLLGVGIIYPNLLQPALWTALVLGSVVSHVPGSIRHFELWGERR